MRIEEVMSKEVRTSELGESAEAAYFRMTRDGIHHLVVLNDGRVTGVVGSEDLGGAAGLALREGKTVGQLMAPNPVVVSPHMTLRQAANELRGRSIGCLPVLEDGRLVGIVTASDVLKWVGTGKTRTQRISTTRAGRRFQRRGSPG